MPVFVVVMLLVNLVFASNRLLGVLPMKRAKTLFIRLVELAGIYAVLLSIFRLAEDRLHGGVYPQGWEFYALSICFFLVMAFPGFVHKYLWKKAVQA